MTKGDVHVTLLDVGYVPGLRFNLFSLHAEIPKCSVTLDADGVHMLGRSLSFVSKDIGSYLEANRVTEDPITVAILVPEKIQHMNINDFHVSLAHSHVETLHETARTNENQGEVLVPFAGYSVA